MRELTQIFAIVALNIRSIPQRVGASLVIVIGIAGVVGVLVAMLSMSAGLEKTLGSTGRDDRAIVLRSGSNAELSSFLDRASATIIKQDPAVLRHIDQTPMAAGELIVITEVPRFGQKTGANVSLRGVQPMSFIMRPEVRVIEGRRFKPGLRELIVGRAAQKQFDGLLVGNVLRFRGNDWRVVGVFETGGDSHESELWADSESVQGAFARNGFSSVLIQLPSRRAFDALEARLTVDPQLTVDVERERKYFGSQSENLTGFIGWLSGIIAFIMAVGALFGALNTMYAAVSARTREIGTLRALGFGAVPVIASVMAEAMFLSMLGGVLGALIAYVLFNGYSVSTLGSGFTQVAFNFAVTPKLAIVGLMLALMIGFFGGLAPALRAARVPVTTALRAN